MSRPKTAKWIDCARNYREGDVILGRGCKYWHTGEETASDRGERYSAHIARIDYSDFSKHVYILAPSGAGKTTLMQSMIYQSARSGRPVSIVVIDGKNSSSFKTDLGATAGLCGKRLVVPGKDGRGESHNPLTNSTDNIKDIVERLVDGFLLAEGAGEDSSYYRATESRFYNAVISCFVKHHDKDITFDDLFWACRRQTAEKVFPELLASPRLNEKDKAELRDVFAAIKEKDLAGAVTNLSPLAEMWQDGARGTVDFYKELVDPGSILYFGFTATNPLSEDAKLFRMVLRELMQLLHKKNSEPQHREIQTRVFIDEFGVLKGETIAEAVALARESNTGFILAHQSFEQLEEAKRKIVFENCATKIFGKMGADAEDIAKHYGDRAITRIVESVSTAPDPRSGVMREAKSRTPTPEMVFKIKPDVIRGLRKYEFIALNMDEDEVEARLFYGVLVNELKKNPKAIKFKSRWAIHWSFYGVALVVLLVSGLLLGPEKSWMVKFFQRLPTIPTHWYYWLLMPVSAGISILACGYFPKAVSIILISALSGIFVAGLRNNYHWHLVLSWIASVLIVLALSLIADWVARNERKKPGRPEIPD